MTTSKLVAFVAALTSAVALSACGDDGGGGDSVKRAAAAGAPAPAELIVQTLQASSGQHSAKFTATVEADIKTSDPQLSVMFGQPVKLTVSGAAAADAVDLAGEVLFAGQRHKLGLKADAKQSFIGWADAWYGPQPGVRARDSDVAAAQRDYEQAAAAVRKHADKLLDGEVSDGPELDGTDTWQLDGTVSADGIAKIAAAEGQPLSAKQQSTLNAVTSQVKISLAVGQDDGLPRRAHVKVDLSERQLAKLKSTAPASGPLPVDRIRASLTLTMSDYGTKVDVKAPQNAQPVDALGDALLGALTGAPQAGGVGA